MMRAQWLLKMPVMLMTQQKEEEQEEEG